MTQIQVTTVDGDSFPVELEREASPGEQAKKIAEEGTFQRHDEGLTWYPSHRIAKVTVMMDGQATS